MAKMLHLFGTNPALSSSDVWKKTSDQLARFAAYLMWTEENFVIEINLYMFILEIQYLLHTLLSVAKSTVSYRFFSLSTYHWSRHISMVYCQKCSSDLLFQHLKMMLCSIVDKRK